MKSSNVSYKLLVCACLLYLTCASVDTVKPVEIVCIPLKSCPLILELITTKKWTPEVMEFVNFSSCGFNGRRQPMVWCSKLDFCITPDNRNGTCTPIKKCKPFLELMTRLDTSDPGIKSYLNDFGCNKVLEGVHVCCPTERSEDLTYEESRSFGGTTDKPNFDRNRGVQLMKDRFANSDYDTSSGWPNHGPIVDSNYDERFGEPFHRHVHTTGPKNHHGSWNDVNRFEGAEDWGMHKHVHHHGPEYEDRHWGINEDPDNFKQNIPEPERGIHKHVSFNYDGNNSNKRKPENGVREHNVISSNEARSHLLPDNHNKRNTGDRSNTNHGIIGSRSWDTPEQTTPSRREETTPRERTTHSSRRTNPHDDFNYTTKPSRRTTTRTTVGNRGDGDIIFEDRFEEIMSHRTSTTTEQTTKRTSGEGSSRSENKKSCKTPDSKAGVCTTQNNCQSYLRLQNNLDKSKKSVREYLNKFKCNATNTREIYVCCQKDEEEDIDNSVISVERSNENIPEPLSKVCGRQTANTNKIFGGTLTDLGEFPWLALLRYPSNKGMQFGCGGTLINSRYVLTAAHCVDENILKSKGLGKLRQVILGEYDTRNETDCIYMKYGEDCADPSKTFGVESIISHDQFSSSTTRHDIALVKLNQEVAFTDYIKPACLPTKTSTLYGNETFVIAGWGRTPTESSSPVLRKAKIPYVQKQNCNSRNTNSRFLIDGQICAGLGNGTDSCNGDSGGPLMLEVNFNFELVTHVVGVISYGFGECGTGPSVNTYVPYYIDWINEKMK